MAEFSKRNYCLHGAESVSSKRPVCLQMMTWTLYDDDDLDSGHIHVCIKLNPQQPNAKMLLSGRMLFLKTRMWVLLDCRVFWILKWLYWGILCFALFCHGLCRLALGLQSISKTVSKYLGLTVPFNNIQPVHVGEKKHWRNPLSNTPALPFHLALICNHLFLARSPALLAYAPDNTCAGAEAAAARMVSG